jgi:hypothetical protein
MEKDFLIFFFILPALPPFHSLHLYTKNIILFQFYLLVLENNSVGLHLIFFLTNSNFSPNSILNHFSIIIAIKKHSYKNSSFNYPIKKPTFPNSMYSMPYLIIIIVITAAIITITIAASTITIICQLNFNLLISLLLDFGFDFFYSQKNIPLN